MAHNVLIVSADRDLVASAVDTLNAAGYDAHGAATFEGASAIMKSESVDLLVTDERLGPFNGLHLVLRGRAWHPDISAFVMSGNVDPVLECDARRLSARCIVKPTSPSEWLHLISDAAERSGTTRRGGALPQHVAPSAAASASPV